MSDDPARQIRKALLTITRHWDDTLEPVRRAPGSHVQTSKNPPLPISAHVLDVRTQCRSRMASTCLMVITERDLHTEHLSGFDVVAMADLLIRHSGWLGEHEAAAIVVWELEESARDLRGITAPHHRDWMSLGICPLVIEAEGEPVGCTGTIRAYPEADPYCDSCGTVAVVSWWERMQFPELDELARLVTAPELVAFVHQQFGQRIQEPTIRKWVERGWISVAAHDDKGRILYDKAAVAYAVTRRKVVA
jgi:hypothetical protein